MYSPSVELTRHGVIIHTGGDPEPYEVSDVGDLLHLWHWRLEGVDPEFTLGDLARLVSSAGDLDVLSVLLNTPLHEVLEPAGAEGPNPDWPLRYLEVCNVALPTRYHPDPHHPDVPFQMIADDGSVIAHEAQAVPCGGPLEILIAVSDPDELTGYVEISRVVAPERHGTWGGPYHVMRMLRGCGAAGPGNEPASEEGRYDLFFAAFGELAHLPLRYNADVAFEGRGEDGEDSTGQVAITVGEFLHAVFWGLGFNGSPEQRIAMRDAVGQRHPDFAGNGGHPLLRWSAPWVH
ncbi:MAG TPA: hypothetical protein VFJ82_03410 [Longimicrobium sp.]|nr:hypothetical protein [Longimicrobium sp.]